MARKTKKKFGGKRRFSAVVLYYSPQKTTVPNFRAGTLLWAEILCVLLLVSKSGTSASPLYNKDFESNNENSKTKYLQSAF